MNKRFASLTALGTCLLAAACYSGLFAAGDAATSWKLLETRYAQANLELAKVRLAMAESENKSVAGTISQSTVDALAAGVQVTQDRLRQFESNDGTASPYAPQIAVAEGALKALENDHSESLKANQEQAGAVSDFEIRREQAEIDVAKARIAALQALAAQPPEVRMQWEIGQLQDEVRALWARPLIED